MKFEDDFFKLQILLLLFIKSSTSFSFKEEEDKLNKQKMYSNNLMHYLHITSCVSKTLHISGFLS